jgi:hypothetical protein
MPETTATITVKLSRHQLDLVRWALEEQINGVEYLLAHHEAKDVSGHRELGDDLRAIRDHVIESLATLASTEVRRG